MQYPAKASWRNRWPWFRLVCVQLLVAWRWSYPWQKRNGSGCVLFSCCYCPYHCSAVTLRWGCPGTGLYPLPCSLDVPKNIVSIKPVVRHHGPRLARFLWSFKCLFFVWWRPSRLILFPWITLLRCDSSCPGGQQMLRRPTTLGFLICSTRASGAYAGLVVGNLLPSLASSNHRHLELWLSL